MKRLPLILVGALVVLGLLFAIGSGARDEEAGPFRDADSCDELVAMFEDYPVPDNASERRAVGDAYRAQFRRLGCEL